MSTSAANFASGYAPGSPAERGAAAILAAFDEYQSAFADITRRAKTRFEQCDWHGMQHDAAERLDLYGRVVGDIVARLNLDLGPALHDKPLWAAMKTVYSECTRSCLDVELAETFFNSVTRRIFDTVGVDPGIEFLFPNYNLEPPAAGPVFSAYQVGSRVGDVIKRVLRVPAFAIPFADLERDAGRIVRAIENERRELGFTHPIDSIDMIHSVFYRNQGAYLVGRIRSGPDLMPLTLALRNQPGGIVVDAALMSTDEVSVIFSFTRASFHVDVFRARDLVAFLLSIMPRKPVAELYNAVGFNKHGKTELFRDLMRHINTTKDSFQIARGDRGMVMIVFTLPGFDVVFKIIRDRFDFPKTASRDEVIDKYRLVFKHDRAGRLADVQEFEHLTFARDRFSPELLEELAAAAETVTIEDRIVHIRHLFTERRMIPLNLYLQDAPLHVAADAIIDYGQAVKDLAATNIFPGDMLLKNFGVTRHGRIVFYDYDEICLLTDCQFRDLPPPADDEQELSAEPWFYVGPRDIFPEEFLRFLGLQGPLRDAFLHTHADLLTADYWRRMQQRHRDGEIMDVIPYRAARRLDTTSHPAAATAAQASDPR